jgi:hypothetical protein
MKKRAMDQSLRDRLLDGLSMRAERLAKVTKHGHAIRGLDTVIAMMARHVFETAMVLLGPTFAEALYSQAFNNTAEGFGMCRFCHDRPLGKDLPMCQVCWDQAASDDDITDDELIAMGLDEGEVDPPAAPEA